MPFTKLLPMAVALLPAIAAGCGPAVPQHELGEVIYELPDLGPPDKPFDPSRRPPTNHGHHHDHHHDHD